MFHKTKTLGRERTHTLALGVLLLGWHCPFISTHALWAGPDKDVSQGGCVCVCVLYTKRTEVMEKMLKFT